MNQGPGRRTKALLGTSKQRGFDKGIGYTCIGRLKEEQRSGSLEIRKQKVLIVSTSLGFKAPKGGGYVTRT